MKRAQVLKTVATDLDAGVASGAIAGWALRGGLALAVWGVPRATLDVDVLADLAGGRAAEAAAQLVDRGWKLVEHARHPGDPVPELLRMSCRGVPVDILVAHRAWEAALVADAAPIAWQGIHLPSVRPEGLAAMKLRAGGPQDIVDADRLAGMPEFDAAAFAAWKRKLRVKP